MPTRSEVKKQRREVETLRRELSATRRRWSLPLAGFAAGALLPFLTGKSTANPFAQVATFGRQLTARLVRLAVVREVLGAFSFGQAAAASEAGAAAADAADI